MMIHRLGKHNYIRFFEISVSFHLLHIRNSGQNFKQFIKILCNQIARKDKNQQEKQ